MINLVVKGTILTLVASVLSYIGQVILIKNFGYSARGVFEIMSSIVGISSTLFSFNYYTVLNIFVADHAAIPRNHHAINLAISLVQTLSALLIIIFLYSNTDTYSEVFVALILITVVLNHFSSFGIAIFNGKQMFLKAKILSIPGYLIALILLMSGIKFKDPNLSAYIFFCLPYVVPGLYVIFLYLKRSEILNISDFSMSFREFFSRSSSVYFISISQIIFQKFFIIWCSSFEAISSIGTFGFAVSIGQFLLMPITFIATIILSDKDLSQKRLNKFMLVSLGYALITVLVIRIGYYLIGLLNINFGVFGNNDFFENLVITVFAIPFCALTILNVASSIRLNKVKKTLIFSQGFSVFIAIGIYQGVKLFQLSNHPMAIAFLFTNIVLVIFSINWREFIFEN